MHEAFCFDAASSRAYGELVQMTAEAVARVVTGQISGARDVMICGAEVDSRIVKNGDLFVALPGERVDGHTFVSTALERASAALVRNDINLPPPPADRALIAVADPLKAYHELATADCRRRRWQIAAVTGSVGKTTTKDFLAHVLADYKVIGKSEGNRNSTLGLPAQVLSQGDDVEVFVAETGMSRPGELDLLGRMLQPDVLLYTRIAPAHTEFFADMAGVVNAKAELLRHLKSTGVLVLNSNDPNQDDFACQTTAAVLTYGGLHSDARIEELEHCGLEGSRGVVILPDGEAPFTLPLPGLHQVENFLAAATAGFALGMPVETIAAAAEGLAPAPHRGTVLHLDDDVIVVDDSYNASPAAMEQALALLKVSPGRRIAVLGEMYELGAAAATAHRSIGRHAASSCDLLLTVGGDNSEALIEGAVAAGLPRTRIRRADDSDAATSVLESLLEPGDTVLVKGSRGVGLDRVVVALSGGKS